MPLQQAFTNRLIHESSPYLLQHAHNPVDWYPWGDAAFARAAREDKPVFLSIGYSACHWCHVMERESFEDEEVAALLSSAFVSVKVDREERPDVDHFYMQACQQFSGSGGRGYQPFLTLRHVEGQAAAQVCTGKTCCPPVTTVQALEAMLG